MEAAELMKIATRTTEMGNRRQGNLKQGCQARTARLPGQNELRAELDRLQELPLDQLIEERYQRFRKY